MIEMEFTMSTAEILGISALLITIISGWIALRVKIQKIDTTTAIKIVQLEIKIKEVETSHLVWVDDLKCLIKDYLTDNKDEHREIMHSVNSIRENIETIKIKLAKLEATKDKKL